MGLDQSLYRVSKLTELDLEKWKNLSLLSNEEATGYWTMIERGECIKAPLALRVFDIDTVRKNENLYGGLKPYFTEVDLYDYGGSDHLYVYAVNLEELACWRKDYELRDALHAICTQDIENTGYYLCDEDMLIAIIDNLKANGEDPDFNPENWDEESLFYWEWF